MSTPEIRPEHRNKKWMVILLGMMSTLVSLPLVHGQQPAVPMVRSGVTEQIAEHVYVIPDGGTGGVPNVGFIVGNNATLVVDTGMGQENGAIVLAEALKISRGTSLYLVTTHVHPEHDLGANAFPDSTQMIRSQTQVAEIAETGMQTADAFRARSERNRQLLEGAEFRNADITFEEEYVLDLGGVSVTLRAMGPNHTAGDTAIFVEQDSVLFSGDIAMQALPAFASARSSLDHWLQSLEMLEALNPGIVVPSHGPLGDEQFIRHYQEYLSTVRDRTSTLKTAGNTVEQVMTTLRTELEAQYGASTRIDGAVRSAYAEALPVANP